MSSPLILAGLAALIAITLAAPEFQGKVPGEMQAMMADMNEKIAALSPNARTAAEAIRDTYMNPKLSKEEKETKKKQIITALNPAEQAEIQGLLMYYMQHYHMPAVMKDIETRMAALSPDANAAAQKIHAFMMDPSISMEEKMKRKDQIIMALKEPAQSEMKAFSKYIMDTYPEMAHMHGNGAAMMDDNSPMMKDIEARMKKLSPDANAAAQKIHAMMADPTVSMEEKMKKKDQIIMALKEPAQSEMKAFSKYIMDTYPEIAHMHENGGAMMDENIRMMKDIEARTKNFSPEAKAALQQINTIMPDPTLSNEEKDKKRDQIIMALKEPARTQMKDLSKYINDNYPDTEQMQVTPEMKKEWDSGVAAMSPNAQKAATKVHEMWMNSMGQSMEEKMKKKDEILKPLTDSEKAEVNNLIATMMKKFPDHAR